MQNKQQELAQLIREGIEKYDLYGRGFTHGQALYQMIRNGWITESIDNYGIEERMVALIGEDLIEMLENRGMQISMKAMAEMIRLEDLDDIVEYLIGEEE